ncbi:exopolyphosphatase [Stigmatella aurantiaca DW4/3-1]|nr:exopolyphosphatase [Stigmatella aurantiaca DW4/3-1]
MEATLEVLTAFAQEARALGAEGIAVSATSAARDAQNGQEFLDAAQQRAGVSVEIISGQMEAQLSFSSVHMDFAQETAGPLLVIDIGGGSTEFIYGNKAGKVDFRVSLDVGSVRITERFIQKDPLSSREREAITSFLQTSFSTLPAPPPASSLVGVAGTVTTLFTVQHRIEPYDALRVQGGTLLRSEVEGLADQLCGLPLEARRALPGLQPKRADVIPAGALILLEALRALKIDRCRVSDRGLRWGLLAHRFGAV